MYWFRINIVFCLSLIFIKLKQPCKTFNYITPMFLRQLPWVKIVQFLNNLKGKGISISDLVYNLPYLFTTMIRVPKRVVLKSFNDFFSELQHYNISYWFNFLTCEWKSDPCWKWAWYTLKFTGTNFLIKIGYLSSVV